MRHIPLEELERGRRLLEEWSKDGASVADLLERLATLSMLVCVNTGEPRRVLQAYVQLVQDIEENPNFDRLSDLFRDLMEK